MLGQLLYKESCYLSLVGGICISCSKWLGLRRNQSVITLEVCDISLVS